MKMKLFSALALAGSIAVSAPALADTIDFGQYLVFASLSDGDPFITNGGVIFTATGPGAGYTRLDEGNGWTGEFATGTPLIFTNGIPGSVTFTFFSGLSSLTDISVQANLTGAYTASASFFNGATLLGTQSYDGVNNLGPQGTIPSFSFFTTGPGITSVVFSTTNDGAGLAIGGVMAVPEPASWTLMIVGFGAVGAGLRSTRRQRAAV